MAKWMTEPGETTNKACYCEAFKKSTIVHIASVKRG